MLRHNTIYKSLLAASLIASALAANAQQTATVNASVSVQNTFTFTKTTDLDFGTVRALQTLDASTGLTESTTAGIRLLADGSGTTVVAPSGLTGADESVIAVIAPGAPAEFTISGAAANTPITITVPSGVTALAALSDAAETFNMSFVNGDFRVVNSDGTEVPYNGINLVTDGTGAVGFKMGGTLRIDEAIDAGDIDDTDSFLGSLVLSVDY